MGYIPHHGLLEYTDGALPNHAKIMYGVTTYFHVLRELIKILTCGFF